jgi:hypothetical protein
MAQDIEDSLGGIYSILAQEYQLPLVEWALNTMEEQGLIDKLPEAITVSITTGLEALGRGHDMAKLREFIKQISIFGPETMMQHIIVTEYFKRTATAMSINVTGLLKSEEQMAAEAKQAQQQMVMQQLGQTLANSPVVKEYAKADANGGGGKA